MWKGICGESDHTVNPVSHGTYGVFASMTQKVTKTKDTEMTTMAERGLWYALNFNFYINFLNFTLLHSIFSPIMLFVSNSMQITFYIDHTVILMSEKEIGSLYIVQKSAHRKHNNLLVHFSVAYTHDSNRNSASVQ